MKSMVSNRHQDIVCIEEATLEFQIRCGAFFRDKRLLGNKNEQEVAKDLNVPLHVIQDYERGEKAIPLDHVYALTHCLGICPAELMELHLHLEKKIMSRPLYEQQWMDAQNMGDLIQQVRKTVFLSTKRLALLLSDSGYSVSQEEILQIERGQKSASIEFWKSLCTLVHLHVNAIHGYSPWQHLAQVNTAFKNGNIRIPLSTRLIQALKQYELANEANCRKISYLLDFSLSFEHKFSKQ